MSQRSIAVTLSLLLLSIAGLAPQATATELVLQHLNSSPLMERALELPYIEVEVREETKAPDAACCGVQFAESPDEEQLTELTSNTLSYMFRNRFNQIDFGVVADSLYVPVVRGPQKDTIFNKLSTMNPVILFGSTFGILMGCAAIFALRVWFTSKVNVVSAETNSLLALHQNIERFQPTARVVPPAPKLRPRMSPMRSMPTTRNRVDDAPTKHL